MDDKPKLLIVGNTSSVHTENLKNLIQDYFCAIVMTDSKEFSLHSPLKLIKSILRANKLLKQFSPSFIILYQIDIAAFFLTFLIKISSFCGRHYPVLVVGIGSDVLTVPDKSFVNKFVARYVINHGNYFNSGSIAIKEKMQKLANKPIEITVANLGTTDIVPQAKKDIIYSNRLHKDLYNIDRIITAFARFISDDGYKQWKLIIAATGMEQQLTQQVKELNIENNVEFVGWLDTTQNAYYYSVSKMWVSLPQSDSISISLLEAMSAGCIPICYDVPALKGFLSDNDNAIIVKDFNENFFKRAFSLNWEKVTADNRRQAREFSDKTLNRQRFYAIFDREFKK